MVLGEGSVIGADNCQTNKICSSENQEVFIICLSNTSIFSLCTPVFIPNAFIFLLSVMVL